MGEGDNRVLELDDETRSLFAVLVRAFRGDVETTRKFLCESYVEFYDKGSRVYDEYLRELGDCVAARGGTMSVGDSVLMGILQEQASDAPLPVSSSDVEREVMPILSGVAANSAASPAPEVHIGRGWRYVDGLKDKLLSCEETAKTTSDNQIALAALGEFARTWIRLYLAVNPDAELEDLYSPLQDRLNGIRVGDEFDRWHVREAILKRGVFAPKEAGSVDSQASCTDYSYLTADERKSLDAALLAYHEELLPQCKMLSGKSLGLVWKRVESSLVQEWLYDKYGKKLFVRLVRDRYYEYADVPGHVAFGLLQAESAGRFFGPMISGGGYDCKNLPREAYEEIRSRAVEDCYLRLNDDLEKGLVSVLRREDYDFKAAREKLARIYGHVFDCAMYSYEATLTYASISVPMVKVLRWQALELKEMSRTLERLKQKAASMPD